MKKTNIYIAITVVLILGMIIFVGCKHHGSKKGHAVALDYISETLDLTEAQESQLADIKDEVAAKVDLLHKDKQTIRESLKEQLASEQIDEAVVKDLVAQHFEKMNQVVDLIVDRLIIFHKDLTPDQKAKLIKKIEKFESWHNHEL